MLKIPYTKIQGTLTTDIAPELTLLPLDAATLAKLMVEVNFVDNGDWTYLRLDNGVYSEEVRVTSIDGSYAVVERGVSGSTPKAFGYLDTKVTSVLGASAITDILSANIPTPNTELNYAGLAYNSNEDPDGTPVVTVDEPNFTSDGTVDVLGAWPNIQIVLGPSASGCCGGDGGSSGGGGGITSLSIGGEILQGEINGTRLNLNLDEPQFNGEDGISVTGSWPYYTISGGGGGGGGTVTSVSVGAGLTLTGSPTVNPSIAIANTGVVAGVYGGVGINARGQIYQVPVGWNPIGALVFPVGATVGVVGGTATVTLKDADVGIKGIVALADDSLPLDPLDDKTAVTPKLLAANLSGSSGLGSGSGTGEADALYTNILSGASIALNLAAGETAVIQGCVQVLDGTSPLTPVAYGIAIFDAGAVKKLATKICTQSIQPILGTIVGPFASTIAIVTTALPSGATVQSTYLTAIKL